jgi:hypothetical protein
MIELVDDVEPVEEALARVPELLAIECGAGVESKGTQFP